MALQGLVEVRQPIARGTPVLEGESLTLDQVMGAVLVETTVSRRYGQVDVRAQVVRHSPSRCSSSRRRRPTRRRRPRSRRSWPATTPTLHHCPRLGQTRIWQCLRDPARRAADN